jgi:phosphatidylglycerol---prolipoprotein diacylglyceryl transferase
MLHIGDAIALVAPIGLLLGRVANFINGELLGRIVALPGEPSPRWAVKFPHEITASVRQRPPLTPEQHTAMERLADQVRLPGMSYEAAYERLLDRVQHSSTDLAARLEPLISARHPSQLYQAFAEGIVLGLVLWFIARKPRIPGVVGAWFLITYGVLRVVTEYWRLPDAHLAHERILGLSRGQWLSIGMVIVGVALLLTLLRRGGERMGGWMKPAATAVPSPPATRP